MTMNEGPQTYGGESVVLVGDPAGATCLYVYCHGPHLLADQRPTVLLDAVIRQGMPLTMSPAAVTQFLTLGLIPMPDSIFSEIHVLGIGDRLDCTRTDKGWSLLHSLAFPYFAACSRQDSPPDSQRLLELLTEAVDRGLGARHTAVMMLSSGKDSTALALALARLERTDVRCLTFTADTDKDEDDYARSLCKRLGLTHEQISINAGEPVAADMLTRFFKNAPAPCGDDCQLPYVAALRQTSGVECVLDGSGNDVYMGHVPSLNDRRRERHRLRSRRLAGLLEAVVPFGTRRDQLLRDPVELCFLQGMFRPREVAGFYPDAACDETFKGPLLQAFDQCSVFDFRAYVRGRHYDQGACALKAHTACAAAGAVCVMPWCDADLADFYFNLPVASRYDAEHYVNKVLLREMLRREIDYPDAKLGKRYFQFDRVAFFIANRRRVADEILSCRFWERTGSERMLAAMYRRLPRNPRVGVALNAWFLLSGWLNHNRWLNP